MSGSPVIREPRPRRYYPKYIHLSVRLDPITAGILEEAVYSLKTTRSKIVRSAIWIVFLLLDPKTTVRKALKPEAVKAIEEGKDVPLVDALKDVEQIAREVELLP